MLPKTSYNVILKNANGLYIGVPSDPFEKIIGLSKLDINLGDDINAIKPNQIGIIYINYENEELTLKRVYTIENNTTQLNLLELDTEELYKLLNDIFDKYKNF